SLNGIWSVCKLRVFLRKAGLNTGGRGLALLFLFSRRILFLFGHRWVKWLRRSPVLIIKVLSGGSVMEFLELAFDDVHCLRGFHFAESAEEISQLVKRVFVFGSLPAVGIREWRARAGDIVGMQLVMLRER